MPKYIVTERSFINNSLVEAGTEIEYAGKPGPNMSAKEKDKAAQAAEAEAEAARGTRDIDQGDMVRQKVSAIGGDPDAVDAARAITAASLASAAALQGDSVIVAGKVISGEGAPAV